MDREQFRSLKPGDCIRCDIEGGWRHFNAGDIHEVTETWGFDEIYGVSVMSKDGPINISSRFSEDFTEVSE